MDNKDSSKRPSIIFKRISMIVSGLIILLYLIFNAGLLPNLSGLVNNILFTIINLIATIYLTYGISLWGWQSENILNQKRIAKTAIRHNRTNQYNISRLIKIIDDKINLVSDSLTKQYFIEIRNHLLTINGEIINSEADFNDLINDELHEEILIQKQIIELQDYVDDKLKELDESIAKSNSDREMESLKRTIENKKLEILNRKIDLPFGTTFDPKGVGHVVSDDIFDEMKNKKKK